MKDLRNQYMMAETKPEEEFAPTNLKLYFSTVPGSHEVSGTQELFGIVSVLK